MRLTNSGGSKGGGAIFSISYSFQKNTVKNRIASPFLGWRLLWEIFDPPLSSSVDLWQFFLWSSLSYTTIAGCTENCVSCTSDTACTTCATGYYEETDANSVDTCLCECFTLWCIWQMCSYIIWIVNFYSFDLDFHPVTFILFCWDKNSMHKQ